MGPQKPIMCDSMSLVTCDEQAAQQAKDTGTFKRSGMTEERNHG